MERRAVHPRNERERQLWPENIEFGHRNIPRGFMDPGKIPTFHRYELAQRVVNGMWALSVKLADSECGHPPRSSRRGYWPLISRSRVIATSACLPRADTRGTGA